MSEQPPEDRKPDISFLSKLIAQKNLPITRNTRLPSIRPPRDLTLGSQAKRIFTPNIPVRRDQRTTNSEPSTSQNGPSNGRKSSPLTSSKVRKKKEANFIQTEGVLSVESFSPKLKSRASDVRENGRPRGDSKAHSSKSSWHNEKLRQDMNSYDADAEMDKLLRDDFIDDDDDDIMDKVLPVSYPILHLSKKETKGNKSENEKGFQRENFAGELGYDLTKISRLIKKEKSDDDGKPSTSAFPPKTVPPVSVGGLDSDTASNLFRKDMARMVLVQLPKSSTVANNAAANNKEHLLSQYEEGKIGKFQILKSGKTRLVIGSVVLDLDTISKVHSKHEVVSVKTGFNCGDMAVIGDIGHKLCFTPNVDDILHDRGCS